MDKIILILMGIFQILTGLAFIVVYYRGNKSREQEFQLKLESAKSAKNSHILNMSYSDLMTIVDTNMLYYVEQSIISSGIHELKTDEQKSLQFNTVLTSVCASVEMSLSTDIKQAIYFYVAPDHLSTYIKDTGRLLLIAKIEQRAQQTK